MKPIFILIFLFTFFSINGQNNSRLSQGDWYKISTEKEGIYKIKYSDFIDLGIDVQNLPINSIRLYGGIEGMLPELNSEPRYTDLVENSIEVYDQNNNGILNNNDYILFYGKSPNVWSYNSNVELFEFNQHLYDDKVYYFITIDSASETKRIQQRSVVDNPNIIINSFNDYQVHEQELINLISSGRVWLGESFKDLKNQNFNFSFQNIDINTPVFIKTSVAARSISPSSFLIKSNSSTINSINLSSISLNYASTYARIAENTSILNNIPVNGVIDLNLEYNSSDNSAEAWLDYIEINAKRTLKLEGSSLFFRNVNNTSYDVAQYQITNINTNVKLWDITHPKNVISIPFTLNNNTLIFNDSLDILREYVVFDNQSYLNPKIVGKINNQNLHGISSNTEYIIVAHPDFLTPANRLAQLHENKNNLNSIVVTPQQIYNEFSSGSKDIAAIRDFLRMQYNKQGSLLKYVPLFGDGSYDPKNRISNNTNYIPTYQSVNSNEPIYSYVTDDFFVLFDDHEGLFNNDLIDIGIGRFPTSTLSQANNIVDKIENYLSISSLGDWRNKILFVADDGDLNDANQHMADADSLANIINDNHLNINIQKIYLDDYEQESSPGGPRSPQTKNAITNSVNDGALIVNYTGHGSILGWAQERILELDQINSFDNFDNLSLFMTATCKFSYFDDPKETSAGELLLLNDKGGAIGLLTTTRLVYSDPNYNLNKKFINNLFEKENNKFLTIGEIFKNTKRQSGTSLNNRNFTLLGDPALKLAYPFYNIETLDYPDTLKALSEVTISGKIVDDQGFLVDNFNGLIYPTIFDKEIVKTTLGQESCIPMPYRDQNNIIYKGEASVENGYFTFTFVTPKDISYNYGSGKISYYAFDNAQNIDAAGSNSEFLIGGISENINYDYEGPEISLFMNSRQFVDGGITDKNPTLIADIFDQSGINTVGLGIGHDITAILDGDTENPYIINSYYKSNKDNYQQGVVSFPLQNLSEGVHTIDFKIWDVFNNSSTASINFEVTDRDDFLLSEFENYPNPFRNNTSFYFRHNQSGLAIEYTINVYSITGNLVKSIAGSYIDNGFRSGPINWDGTDNNGRKIQSGIYLARIEANIDGNKFASKSIRIIITP